MQKADLEDMICTVTLIHISSKVRFLSAMPLSKISLKRVQVAKCNSINQLGLQTNDYRFPRNLLASQNAGNINVQRAFAKNIDNNRIIEIMC
ncbi:hypothetical protein Glove_390g40 [Diversispora epigaea]|uniref:Uncharacterized protein n=1 Tax=Diversispora epigaea TaxID=1348612 RepID=A0A397H3L0_9GLOM|nr:hypothetical protein Glove_390g40 [Diversispora epigaea]